MMRGKIIGGLIGLLMLGFVGAMLGIFFGHLYDQAVERGGGFGAAANREVLETVFLETTFRVLGHIAKADGRVSEAEVAHTEALMSRMDLQPHQRRRAIALFKEGAAPGFALQVQIDALLGTAGRDIFRMRLFLEQLISIALADGELHDAERDVLAQVAHMLGVPRRQFMRLLDMLAAQANFGGGYAGDGAHADVDRLDTAYRALGVSADDSDADIKRAYRKLLSEHHPDKLIAKGMPDDVIKMANEKTQELHAAWETIKAARAQ